MDLYNFQSCPVMHWSAKVDIRFHCTHTQHLIKTGSQCSNTAVNCNTIINVFHSIWILWQVKAIHFLKQVNLAKSCVYITIDSKTMWPHVNNRSPLYQDVSGYGLIPRAPDMDSSREPQIWTHPESPWYVLIPRAPDMDSSREPRICTHPESPRYGLIPRPLGPLGYLRPLYFKKHQNLAFIHRWLDGSCSEDHVRLYCISKNKAVTSDLI